MVVSLEGWWVSELEINWHILSGNYDNTSSELRQGGNDYRCLEDADGHWESPRRVDAYYDVNLFNWIKSDTYGSYTVYFRETDTSSKVELWTSSVQIVGKVVGTIWANNKLVKTLSEELVPLINKLIEVGAKDDEIGEAHVAWSLPNGIVQYVNGNGFEVIINQKD